MRLILHRWTARARALRAERPRLLQGLSALLCVLVWAVWVWGSVLPEWTGSRANQGKVQKDFRDRVIVTSGYGAAWLTRYYEAHGELPEEPPRNPAAAGNRAVIELCPQASTELIRTDADWALCAPDRKVRALVRHSTLLLDDGGHQTPLSFTQNGTP